MTMNGRWAVAFAVALPCGCAATNDNRGSDDMVTFTLQAGPRNLGETGKALMGPRGDKTVVMLNISGVPPWVVRPVQLYTFVYAGSCAAHGTTPAYALNEIVSAGLLSNNGMSGPFTLEKTVPLPMNTIRSGNYAIVVRTSPADQNVDIYCGDMK